MSAKEQLRHILNQKIVTGQTVAKWLPREKSSKGHIAREIMQYFGMSAKFYRQSVADMSETVEDLMCAQKWNDINFSQVPSLAAARYQKAFTKQSSKYAEYKAALASGDPSVKINAAAIFPYDVIKAHKFGGDKTVIQAQWDALPDYMGDELVLPVCDVSGSMSCSVGGNKNLTCLDVCVSLGLYLADKNKGPFKDMFLTFSDTSKLQVLKGTLIDKLAQLKRSEWSMSTNLHSAFEAILTVAVKGNVSANDMPKKIVIFSDMQFNVCVTNNDSAMQMIERKYTAAGYEIPAVIFWNLNAKAGQSPVSFDKKGTALVSGFSPSLLKNVLKGENLTPHEIMMQTLNDPRYAVIV